MLQRPRPNLGNYSNSYCKRFSKLLHSAIWKSYFSTFYMGKAWSSLHMNKTRMRARMCMTVVPTLRHTWTQEGLPITWSLEFFDLQTNSDSSTMVLNSPIVKFYKNPFSRFPVITCVKTDWQIKKAVIVDSPNVKAHTVYPRFSQSLLWTDYIF
jgi:hypothetical protein